MDCVLVDDQGKPADFQVGYDNSYKVLIRKGRAYIWITCWGDSHCHVANKITDGQFEEIEGAGRFYINSSNKLKGTSGGTSLSRTEAHRWMSDDQFRELAKSLGYEFQEQDDW